MTPNGVLPDVAEELVDHRADPAVFKDVHQVFFEEVSDADGFDFTFVVSVFEGFPYFAFGEEAAVFGLVDFFPRLRAVDEHHIDVVKAHFV